jgi:hypothetical protein
MAMSAPDEPVTVNTRDTLSGQLQRVTPEQYEVYKHRLEIVADDAKPFVEGLFKPGLVGEVENAEPPTDAVAEAQAAYDAVIADGHAPNSTAARQAKAALVAAEEEAERQVEESIEIIEDTEEQQANAAADTAEGEAQ